MPIIVLNCIQRFSHYLQNTTQYIVYHTDIINKIEGDKYNYKRWDKYVDKDGNIKRDNYPKSDSNFTKRLSVKKALKEGKDILLNIGMKKIITSTWEYANKIDKRAYPTSKPYKLLKRIICLSTV